MCSTGFVSERRPLRVLRVMDRLGYGERLHGAGRVWLNSLGEFNGQCTIIPCVLRMPEAFEALFAKQAIVLWQLKKARFDPSTIAALCGLIRSEHINVLHLEGFGAATFGRIAGFLTGKPAIIQLHDMHRCVPWYVRIADWCLAPFTAGAIAVSEGVAEACVKKLHIPRSRVIVIPNAIRAGWVQPVAAGHLDLLRQSLGIPASARIVGSVAHLQAEKDVPSLIKAVSCLRASGRVCHVVVVGEGPDRPQVEEQIRQLGLADYVHLVGFQPNVRPYLSLMEVAVFSSVSEGCPNTLLEAMAMGRPVVATAARGIIELIRDGENGLLVPVGDAQAIARGIERLLDEPVFAARMAEQVKKDAEAYQMPAHVDRLQRFYQSIQAGWVKKKATQWRHSGERVGLNAS